MKTFKQYLKEVIKVPIKIGDTVLGGKFKNKRIVVKSIGKNEKGDITINGRPLLKYRILDEQYITEASRGLVKGWVHKSGTIMDTTMYNRYHIMQVSINLRKFGLNKNKMLKIIRDAYPDAPEEWAEEHLDNLQTGKVDNDKYIEEYLQKRGWCMFVIDKTHGSISGWDEKSTKQAAKALDAKHLPYETRKGLKLFEVKLVRGRSKYITSKYDWYNWLEGKKTAGKRTAIGSTMAQFREQFLRLKEEKKGGRSSYMDVGHYTLHRDMKQVELFHHGAVSGHKKINHLELYKKVANAHKKRTKGHKLDPTWADHDAWMSQVDKKKGRATDEAGDREHTVQGRIDHKTKTYTISNTIPAKYHKTSETHQARVINHLVKKVKNRLTKEYPEYKEHQPEDTGVKGYHVEHRKTHTQLMNEISPQIAARLSGAIESKGKGFKRKANTVWKGALKRRDAELDKFPSDHPAVEIEKNVVDKQMAKAKELGLKSGRVTSKNLGNPRWGMRDRPERILSHKFGTAY